MADWERKKGENRGSASFHGIDLSPSNTHITYSIRDTRERELGRELDDVLLELSEQLGSLTGTLGVGLDKVLEQLGAGLLLGEESDLNGSVEEVTDDLHVLLGHGSGSEGGKTDTDTTGYLSRSVTRNGVLVHGDVSLVTNLLNLGTGKTERSEIPQDQVVVSSIGLELVVVREQNLGHSSGVGNNLLSVSLESRVSSLLEGNSDTGDRVVVGSTLASREDGLVDSLFNIGLLVLSEEDQTSSGSSERLVSGRADDITVLERRVLLTGSNETGDVSHVREEVRTVGVGDLSETGVVPVSRVSRSTTDDQSRLVETGVGG